MSRRTWLWVGAYSAASVAAFAASVWVSAANSYDFFTLVQELTQSVRLTALLNFIVFVFLAAGSASVHAVFRHVRLIELEHIADQLPFYGFNLVFIVFNDSNIILNIVWTGLTMLSKVYHIITYDRVDLLQVQVVNRVSSHACTRASVLRAFALNPYVSMILLLLAADLFMARLLAYDVFQGISSMGSLLFGIQFGIMAIECFTYFGKLVLYVYELVVYRTTAPAGDDDASDAEDDLQESIWENRPFYVHGFEILSSAVKATFYSLFLYTLYFHSRLSLPIPVIQGCVVAIHSTVKQFNQLKVFFRQSKLLDAQLAAPTDADLEAADHMCIICRETMHAPDAYMRARSKPLNPRKTPKKLRCGHIMHLCCLKDWLERSQSCPLCRQPVFKTEPQEPVPPPAPVARPEVPTSTLYSEPMATAPQTTQESAQAFAAAPPTPTPTVPAERTHSQVSDGDGKVYTFGFAPSDWACFPVACTPEPGVYSIKLSSSLNGSLRVKRRPVPSTVRQFKLAEADST